MSRLDIGRRVDEHVRPDTPALQGFAFARCCGFSSASIPHALTGKVGSGSRRFRPHAVASSWLHTGLAPAAIHPCQAHPVALRAPSDPADVILSINVLIYDPPPPSTLISRSGLSQGCWHRGLLLFRCVLSTDFGTSMPSMSAEESIPSLDGGSTAQDAVTDRDAGNDLVETGSAPPASTSPCQHQITEI